MIKKTNKQKRFWILIVYSIIGKNGIYDSKVFSMYDFNLDDMLNFYCMEGYCKGSLISSFRNNFLQINMRKFGFQKLESLTLGPACHQSPV